MEYQHSRHRDKNIAVMVSLSYLVNSRTAWARGREMTRSFKAFAAPAENLGSSPNIPTVAHSLPKLQFKGI